MKKYIPFTIKPLLHYVTVLARSDLAWVTGDTAAMTSFSKHTILLVGNHSEHATVGGVRSSVTHEVVERTHKTKSDTAYTPEQLDEKEQNIEQIAHQLLLSATWVILLDEWLLTGFIAEMKNVDHGVVSNSTSTPGTD